jgi:glutamate racemase
VLAKAAPELVDLVEAGKAEATETEAVLRKTLEDIQRFHADTLILGCTHYPLLRPLINKIVGDGMTVVDSAETTAARVKRVLAKNGLESGDRETPGHQIYVTGSPERFTDVARILFGQDLPPIKTVRLELVEARNGREGAA